jgi:hypothetical protein
MGPAHSLASAASPTICRMRKFAVLSLAVVVSTGCGGKHASAPRTPQIIGGIKGIPRSADCTSKKIVTSAAGEGVCVAKGSRITAADAGHRLRMKEYDARLEGTRTARAVGRRAASNFEPRGRFVLVTLWLKNTGTAPRAFDRTSQLVFLLVDHDLYPEVPGAEAELADSFRSYGAVVAPGRAHRGAVVFDLPQRQAERLRARGSNLVFLNLDEQGNGFPHAGTRSMGFIRLWK